MRDEHVFAILLHSIIRTMLLRQPIDEAYAEIFKSTYPCGVFGKFSRTIDREYLQKICDLIYSTDKREVNQASCYSASLVAQLVAFAHGIATEMAFGIRKQDEKVVGHAWLEIKKGAAILTINPGNENLNHYSVIKRLNPLYIVEKYVENLCATGSRY